MQHRINNKGSITSEYTDILSLQVTESYKIIVKKRNLMKLKGNITMRL